MTLGRIEEVLDEVETEARADFSSETLRYVVETLDTIRRRLGLDTSELE